MTTKVVSSHTCPTCLEFLLPTQSLLSYALLGATKMAEPEDEPPSVLLPCSICSRTFKPESLQKHIKACEKQLTKKRKVFDSSKQRIQGTELAEFLPIILREKKSEKVPVKKQESKWKEKHLEFVRAIRAARGVEVESIKNVPAPRSNHEKCPHCDRNFGPKAFDRHVEWCKEQKARIPKSPGSLQAKERLEARTKYRAPPLAKSKRTLTREKYAKGPRHTQEMSPMGSRSIMTFSKMSPNNPHESKPIDVNSKIQSMRNKPKVSASSPSCILPGGNIQIKRREPSPSPNKRPIRSKNIGKTSVLKEKSEDKHRENTFTSSNISKLQTTSEKVTREGKSHATDKRLPVPKATLTVQKTQERKSGQPKVCAQFCKTNDGSSSKFCGTDNPHLQGKSSYQPRSSTVTSCKSTPLNLLSEGLNHEGSLGVVPVSFHDSDGNIPCETFKRTESRAHGGIARRQKPKLNDIDVNHNNKGLIVSPCSILKAEDNFITWRDIARNSETILKRTNTDLESDDCNRTYTVVSSCTDDSQTNIDVENTVSVEELNSEEYYSLEGYSSASEMYNKKGIENLKGKSHASADSIVDSKLNPKSETSDIQHNKCDTGEINMVAVNVYKTDNYVDSLESFQKAPTGTKHENVPVLSAESSSIKENNNNCTVNLDKKLYPFESTENETNAVMGNFLPASNQNSVIHSVETLISNCDIGKSFSQYEKDSNCLSFRIQDSLMSCSSYNTENREDVDGERLPLGEWNDTQKVDEDSDIYKTFNSFMISSEEGHFANEKERYDDMKISLPDDSLYEKNQSLSLGKGNSSNCKLIKEIEEIKQNSEDCNLDQSKNTNDFSQHVSEKLLTENNIVEVLSHGKISATCSDVRARSDVQHLDSFCSDVSKYNNPNKVSSVQNNVEECYPKPSVSGELSYKPTNDVLSFNNSGRLKSKFNTQFPFCRKSCFCCFEKTGQLTQEQAFTIWQSCKKEALDFLGLPDTSKHCNLKESSKSYDDVIDRIWDLASQEFIKVMKEKSCCVCSLNDKNSEYKDYDISHSATNKSNTQENVENKTYKYYEEGTENCKNKCSFVGLSMFCNKIVFPHKKYDLRKKYPIICKSGKRYKKFQKLNRIIKKSFYLESLGKIIFLCNEAVFTSLAIKSGGWLNISKTLKNVLDSRKTMCFMNQNDPPDLYKLIGNNGFKMCDGSGSSSSSENEKLKSSSGARTRQMQVEYDSKKLNNSSASNLKQFEVKSQLVIDSTQTSEEVEEILRVKSAVENVTIRTYEIVDPSEMNVFAENYHSPPLCHLENLLLDHNYGYTEDTCFTPFYSSHFTEIQDGASLNDVRYDRNIDENNCFYPDVYIQGNDVYDSLPFYDSDNQYYIPEQVYNPVEMSPSEIPYTLYFIPGSREGCIITECSDEENAREKSVPSSTNEKLTQNIQQKCHKCETKPTTKDSLKKRRNNDDNIGDMASHEERDPASMIQVFDEGQSKISEENNQETYEYKISNLNGNIIVNNVTQIANHSVVSDVGLEYCALETQKSAHEKVIQNDSNEKLHLIKKSHTKGKSNRNENQPVKSNIADSRVSKRKIVNISPDSEYKKSNVCNSIKLTKYPSEGISDSKIVERIPSLVSSSDSLETNYHSFKNSLECFDLSTEEGSRKMQNSSEFMASVSLASYDDEMTDQEVKEQLEDISCLGVDFPSFLYEHMDYHNGNVKVWTNSIKQKTTNSTLPSDQIKVRKFSAKKCVSDNKDKSFNTNFCKKVEKSMLALEKNNDYMYEKAGKVNRNCKSSNRNERTKSSLQKSSRYNEKIMQSQASYCVLNENKIFDTPPKQMNLHCQKIFKCKNNLTLPEIQGDETPKLKSAKEHNASLSKLVEKWMTKQKKVKTSQSEQEVNKKVKTEPMPQKRNIRKTHRLPPLSAMPKCQLKTSSSEEVYDPYVSAERQMMELLSQGDYVQPVPLSNTEPSPVFPSFDSSHKSAFVSPESRRTFSSKSHLEKGDADKRVYDDNCIYKIDNSTELENKSKCHSFGGKFSADSAYGSLKRRSPGNQLPEKHVDGGGEGEPMGVMSSSSSESSLPPLCAVQILKSEASNPSSSPTPSLAVSASPVTQSVPRMSKFCHECGSKYPVSLAKFCCECGVRRLAM